MKAFASVKKNYKNGNITTFTSAELSSLSNIICGATGDEINSLQAKEVGLVSTCDLCGAWWCRGMFGALQPEGCGFESTSRGIFGALQLEGCGFESTSRGI